MRARPKKIEKERMMAGQEPSENLFGGLAAGPGHARKRNGPGTFRRVVAVVAVLAVLGSAAWGVVSRSDGSPRYRTAQVRNRTVTENLELVGTIEPVSQAAVTFPVSGTVQTVSVAVGDTVSIGQVLAGLDESDLKRTLHDKQAVLADSRLVLAQALQSQSDAQESETQTTTTVADDFQAGGFSGRSGAGASALTDAGPGDLRAMQEAVVAAQRKVSESIALASTQLANAPAICGVGSGGTGDTSNASLMTGVASAGAEVQAMRRVEGSEGMLDVATEANAVDACRSALETVLRLQSDVANSQRDLATASDTYSGWLASSAASAAAANAAAANATPTSQPSTGNSNIERRAIAEVPTAADLVSLQAAVDSAEAGVALAEQAVSQATIVSPIAGTVIEVGLGVGDLVAAASSSDVIVVVGDGGSEASALVSVTDVSKVEVGRSATVTLDSSGRSLKGQVVRVGVAAQTSGSTTMFPVTIALPSTAGDLGNGDTAAIDILINSASDVIAVPTSAVTRTDTSSTVTVLEAGVAEPKQVKVGIVGTKWTEIAGGLESGQQVVLADLDAPLPTTAAATSSRRPGFSSGLSGGFRGGQMPPGAGPPG